MLVIVIVGFVSDESALDETIGIPTGLNFFYITSH